MSTIRVPLVTNEYYHIYNRGVARQPIFLSESDYQQAMLTLLFYRVAKPPMKLSRYKELSRIQKEYIKEQLLFLPKRVEIVAFALMPNHFHLLLKQTEEKGITTFISEFTNSYTKFFNTKYDRVGPVFQGIFKAVHIESEEQLIHLSRYIHLNPVVSNIITESELFSYQWTSLPLYRKQDTLLINANIVLDLFSSVKDYETFVMDNVDYAKELDTIKHLVMEK